MKMTAAFFRPQLFCSGPGNFEITEVTSRSALKIVSRPVSTLKGTKNTSEN